MRILGIDFPNYPLKQSSMNKRQKLNLFYSVPVYYVETQLVLLLWSDYLFQGLRWQSVREVRLSHFWTKPD